MEQENRKLEGDQERQADFKCKYCGDNTHEDVVKAALWLDDRTLVAIADIPARVCEGCREQFYDEETTQKINKLMMQDFPAKEALRNIVVPEFSLTRVQISKAIQRDSIIGRKRKERRKKKE